MPKSRRTPDEEDEIRRTLIAGLQKQMAVDPFASPPAPAPPPPPPPPTPAFITLPDSPFDDGPFDLAAAIASLVASRPPAPPSPAPASPPVTLSPEIAKQFHHPLTPSSPPPAPPDDLSPVHPLLASPPPLPPDFELRQPAYGRVIHNTDLESHARWAEFDRLMAAGVLRAENELPPEAEGVMGTTPERSMVERYCRRYPHTVYAAGQFYRWQAGLWSPVSLDRFHYEINAIVDHARATGNVPSGPLQRLPRLIAERVREKLAIAALGPPPPLSLPLANGLLDLATLELQPHTPENFVAVTLPYAYDPAARAPVWEAFLQSRLPDCADFVQEYAGLALTPHTHHERALWLHGRPGSGKSTFLHGLQVLLGPLAGPLNPAHLLTGRFSPQAVLGKTLLVCAEPPALSLAHPAPFNALVSGEPLTAHPPYRQPQVVHPIAKVAWAFTQLPRLPDADSPLFRRVSIVPFPHLPEDQRDPALKARLDPEGPGLLNWALAGLQRLTARGRFEPPPAVLAATEAFRQSNDLPALFLEECCQLDPEYKAAGSRLHQAFKDWCSANGHTASSSTVLAGDWARLGLQRRRLGGHSYWFGARVRGL